MPTPSSSQAADMVQTEPDAPRSVQRTWRPPSGPTRGPRSPEITSDPENAAKNQLLEIPRSRAI
jgi:hypothetical protein